MLDTCCKYMRNARYTLFAKSQKHSQILKVYFRFLRADHRSLLLRWFSRDHSRWNQSHSHLCYFHHYIPCHSPTETHKISGHQYSKQVPFIWSRIKMGTVRPLVTLGPGDPRTINTRGTVKADSHIACRAHATPMPFPCHAVPLIHTCHAAPLPCSDSAVSFVKVRVVAGNIRTASPTV